MAHIKVGASVFIVKFAGLIELVNLLFFRTQYFNIVVDLLVSGLHVVVFLVLASGKGCGFRSFSRWFRA